jgi:hypothetical protein
MMNKTTNFITKKSRLNQRINKKHSQNLLKLKLSASNAKRCFHSETSFTNILKWVAKRWNLFIRSKEIREIYKDFECRNVYCDEINYNEIHDVHVK